jgi:AraC-like DNA-binding protein
MDTVLIEGDRFRKGLITGTKLVFCERFDESSSIWNLKEHVHPFLEVMYFLNGGAKIHSIHDELTLSVFDIIIYPENMMHHEDVDMSRHQEVVCLGFQIPGLSGLDNIHRLTDFDSHLKWLFIEIHAQCKGDGRNKHVILDLLVQLLLHYLKNTLDTMENIDDPIRRIMLYMNENIGRSLDIGQLADIANYSASYLDRKFKERTGISPLKYLKRIRMDTAKILLGNMTLELSKVAAMVGFDDPKYFSRIFSETYGISPNTYRRSLERF